MRRIVCFGDSLTSGHGIGSAAAYRALLHQKVRRAGLPFEVQLMQADRAHSNAAGAQAIADTIWRHLEPMLTGPVLASRG